VNEVCLAVQIGIDGWGGYESTMVVLPRCMVEPPLAIGASKGVHGSDWVEFDMIPLSDPINLGYIHTYITYKNPS
jgi:hypothetical protein